MARQGGLKKWFGEKWVDISRPKKGGGYAPCCLLYTSPSPRDRG